MSSIKPANLKYSLNINEDIRSQKMLIHQWRRQLHQNKRREFRFTNLSHSDTLGKTAPITRDIINS